MRKRWIIGGACLAVLLGTAYTGYWFWLAQTFEQNLALWIDQQRAMGYRISYSADTPNGFPFSVTELLVEPAVESHSGSTPWRLRTESLRVSIAPWSPFRVRLNDGYVMNYFLDWGKTDDQHSTKILVGSSRAGVTFADDGAAPVVDFRLEPVFAFEGKQRVALLHNLQGRIETIVPGGGSSSSPAFSVNVGSAHFDDLIQSPLGQDFSRVAIEGRITGAVSQGTLVDALDAWRDDGGTIELTRLAAVWGPLAVTANGTLALDPQLQPIGAFTAEVRGHNEAIDAAVAGGFMTSAQGTAAKLWINARAEKDDGGFKVKLPLTIQDGFLSMGPIKLAQVPKISWE